MRERRWLEERRWEVDGIWRVAAGGRTDAEVLAEMGGERVWRCAATQRLQDRPCDNRNGQCGWVWVVKEATDA